YSFSFFFSSRRRHTRFDCDWSSDVCSSDLDLGLGLVDWLRDENGQVFGFGLVNGFSDIFGLVFDLGLVNRISYGHVASLSDIIEIGRASCRERVYMSELRGSYAKKIIITTT